MSRSSGASSGLQTVSSLVNRALTLLEDYKRLSDRGEAGPEGDALLTELQVVLRTSIPRHPNYPQFSKRGGSSPFWEAYIKLLGILDKIEAQKARETPVPPATPRQHPPPIHDLEQRFEALRRPSASGMPRPGDGMPANPKPLRRTSHTWHDRSGAPQMDPGVNPSSNAPYGSMSPEKDTGERELGVSTVNASLSRLLLVDVRKREEFDARHIPSRRIVCLEPVNLRPGMSVQEVEDTLVIAPQAEQDAWEQLGSVEKIVLYDNGSRLIEDSSALSYVASALETAGYTPYLLRGGLSAWEYAMQRARETAGLRSGSPLETNPQGSQPQGSYSQGSQGPQDPLAQSFATSKASSNTTLGLRANGFANGSSAKLLNGASNALPPELIDGSLDGYSNGYVTTRPRGPRVQPELPAMPKELKAPLKMPTPTPVPPLRPQHAGNGYSLQQEPPIPPPQGSPPPVPKSIPVPYKNGRATGTVVTPQGPDLPPKLPPSTLKTPEYPALPPAVPEKIRALPLKAPPRSWSSPEPRATSEPAEPNTRGTLQAVSCTTGLKNLGNTCYMNCVLQCLLGVAELVQPFVNSSYRNRINVKSRMGYQGKLAHEFAALVRATTQPNTQYVAPYGLKTLSGQLVDTFSGYEQQDCQEFLTFLFDGLHEDLNRNGHLAKEGELNAAEERRREQLSVRAAAAIEWERYMRGDVSLIVDIFQGQVMSRLQCSVCRTTSTTYNAFSTLSLPIPPHRKIPDILDCVNEFVKPEVLDGDNAWFCPQCQRKQRTIKILQISHLPPVLVVHLQRFRRTAFSIDKLETPVSYPLRGLDLTPYWPAAPTNDPETSSILAQIPSRGQQPPFIYDLCAVTLHHGSLKSGHYTAVVYKPLKGWCYFDDMNVTAVPENAAVARNAYVLFYRRRQ